MPNYGLPEEIKFCKKCVLPNTRATSCNEYKNTREHKHQYVKFDDEGVCSACRFIEAKENEKEITWEEREKELIELLDKHRSKDGSYDCVVPGSGGKDSAFAAHILKYKYGMHPLTVTWSPHLYTDIGWKNFRKWMEVGGLPNYLYTPNGKIHRMLTRNAFLNLLHPFQTFVLGQKTIGPKMAALFNIKLVFYGESQGDYGANISINQKGFTTKEEDKKDPTQNIGSRMDHVDSTMKNEDIYIGGKSVADYLKEGVEYGELTPYLPLDPKIIKEKGIIKHYLGYYLKWVPQDCYYYAVKNTGFEANPERTEGTYSKYNSIDDKTDGFFYFTNFIKFGFGRATRDASQEVRNHHITRDEAIALVRRFDGEFPKRYFKEFLEYIDQTEEEFWKTIDSFRDPHLWKKENEEWKLKYKVETN
ncbi:MAG: N-acetyl sugar amidotransferase [Candidatus Pacebacteria bacterium]|jgi:N-acetyl sugar amidotransferase|nr:N-acetyl sugar amidotransferase [Candidatus Paceibacterota bacterium]